MLTFDLTIGKPYKVKADNLEEAISKLKKMAIEKREDILEDKNSSVVIIDTHEVMGAV